MEYSTDGVVESDTIPFDEAAEILNIVSDCQVGVYVYTCDICKKTLLIHLGMFCMNRFIIWEANKKNFKAIQAIVCITYI